MVNVEEKIFLARVAEQAERFEDMVDFFLPDAKQWLRDWKTRACMSGRPLWKLWPSLQTKRGGRESRRISLQSKSQLTQTKSAHASQRDAGVRSTIYAGFGARHTSHGSAEPTQGAGIRLRLERSRAA